MSRLKVRRTSRCNFLSLFSTFLPILNLECKLQHISEFIILISHIWFGTFLGFRTFWWAKTNVEKGCWTWEITMNCLNHTFSNLSNFFFRATFSMCVLKVEPLPSTIIAVFEVFWYVWKALSNQTKTLLLGETVIQFSLKCNDVSIIGQVFPSTVDVWNRSGWGGWLRCSSHGIRSS